MVKQCEDKPVETKQTTMVTRTINNVVDAVHFDSGKAVIPPSYMNKLNKLVELTKDKQNVRFKFVGHTDNQRLKPSTKAKFGTNQGLSEARATEVAQYVLENLHIKTQVSIDGKGETQPVASNDNPQGMAKNRRVELVMLYDEPQVSIKRSTKQECVMKPAAPQSPLAQKAQALPLQPQASKSVQQAAQALCTTETITEMPPVVEQILARSKTGQLGWENEIESLDPSNTGSLQNLSRLAGKDGDISSGLMEAYRQQVTRHQTAFAQEQAAEAGTENAEPQIPNPKEVVKTITQEQGKAGTWLWPVSDTSLDGRFMAVVRAGVTPTLQVNGKTVPNSQLGEQIENKSAKAQVLAWYGVELDEGENTLTITAKGPFGNERTLAEKVFKRPSSGVAIRMKAEGNLMADGGRSTVPVQIEILDRNGYPAKGTYFLTLEASDGLWAEPDIQDKVSGHQVKVTNGQRTVHLRSSSESGQIKLRASTGKLISETDVAQVAELRPLIAVGLLDLRAYKGYRDSYESLGLQQLDPDRNDVEVNGRAALFMKGRVRGDMHLTLAYDNQKDSQDELLRDIDPAEYYRVYGDSSLRGFEAQSRSQLYAKLEKDRNSLMWGDYLTDNGANSADIARSQRTLTGVNGIYDNGKTRFQMFAAQQDNMRGFEEIPGNGTAMQYQLQDAPIVENSEVVEIITRDRANIGLIIASETLQRFRDYSIDDITGYITFHRVIPTLDDELNPVSIRITYDRIEEGESYLVAGVRLMHRLSDELKVGASYTRDEHETEGYQLAGVYTEYQDETTQLELGVARMTHNNDEEDGTAVRLKATKKWTPESRTELLAAQADAGFTSTTSGVIADRRELKVSQYQKIGKDTEAKLEYSQSEALSLEDKRRSLELSATTRVDDWTLKGGVRRIEQSDGETTDRANTAIIGVERGVELFGRKGSVKAEYEHEIGNGERERAAIGAEMQLTEKTKGYIRYERADRLASGTLAGAVDTRNNLVAGVKSQVLPSTEMYSEYRIEGDISGQEVVAANGAKATLNLEENLVLTPSIEFLTYLESNGSKDSIAASIGIKDTRDPDSKKLLRAETRHNEDETFYGLNGTYVQKLNDTTTVMLQDELRLTQYDDDREDNLQNTLTLAAAHRHAR
ncbi:MAG: OmpA family protein [Thiolinea sp.]